MSNVCSDALKSVFCKKTRQGTLNVPLSQVVVRFRFFCESQFFPHLNEPRKITAKTGDPELSILIIVSKQFSSVVIRDVWLRSKLYGCCKKLCGCVKVAWLL
jgi:hypothetical protein